MWFLWMILACGGEVKETGDSTAEVEECAYPIDLLPVCSCPLTFTWEEEGAVYAARVAEVDSMEATELQARICDGGLTMSEIASFETYLAASFSTSVEVPALTYPAVVWLENEDGDVFDRKLLDPLSSETEHEVAFTW